MENLSKSRTFAVSEDIFQEFVKICKDKCINRSKLIEKYIKEFIKENKK